MTLTQQQNLLQYLGYYVGRVDGISGPLTESAVEEFRRDNGNPNTGSELDEVLIGAVFHGRFKGTVGKDVDVPTPEEVSVVDDWWPDIKYFGRHEFACKCGTYCDGYPVEPKEALMRALDEIRERTGLPVYINSGIRCPAHNEAVGGAPKSRHMDGDAADICCPGKTPRELYDIACAVVGDRGGVGLYSWGVHVDMRGHKARW